MSGRVWVEIQWGVLYTEAEQGRAKGTIESFGTRPSGVIGQFTHDDCHWIASRVSTRRLVRKQIVHREEDRGWEEF